MADLIEKRAYQRMHANQGICICASGIIRLGTLINCSESGMYIDAVIKKMDSFPLPPVFEVHIPLEAEVLKVLVKVVRFIESNDFYEGMGVELLNIPRKYLEFVIKLSLCS